MKEYLHLFAEIKEEHRGHNVICINETNELRICFWIKEKSENFELEDWDDYDPKYYPHTTMDNEKGECWYNEGWYFLEYSPDYEVWTHFAPTHVLDLSKLTTKERAIEAINATEKIVDAWHEVADTCGITERINALKAAL